MSTPDRTRYYSFSFLIRFLALLAFIGAFCFAQGWLTVGNWQEWVSGGLALYVLAEFA
jgi:hypothetical protein